MMGRKYKITKFPFKIYFYLKKSMLQEQFCVCIFENLIKIVLAFFGCMYVFTGHVVLISDFVEQVLGC